MYLNEKFDLTHFLVSHTFFGIAPCKGAASALDDEFAQAGMRQTSAAAEILREHGHNVSNNYNLLSDIKKTG